MKKRISFKMWISVLWRGIRQFFGNLFSWKNKGRVGKFVGICFGLFFLSVCVMIGFLIYEDSCRLERWADYEALSPRIQFVHPYDMSKRGWISRSGSREKLVKNVDWVIVPDNQDSLAVFSQNGKRGYINRYSGRVAVTPKYDAAWVFAGDMAAVAEADSIRFINAKGEPAMAKSFPRNHRLNPVFHGDYCIMSNRSDGDMGLIDRYGNWVLEPVYDEILPAPHNYWKVRKGDEESGLWYAFNDRALPLTPSGVRSLEIDEELGVVYTLPNHMSMVVDFEGNRMESFLCSDIEPMYYDTDKRDKEGEFLKEQTTLYRYRMPDGYEGLCKENGEIVTEPLFWIVKSIGKDLYMGIYKNSNIGVIINSNGEITK